MTKQLVEGVNTEYEAVSRILNFVVDNVNYTYNPPQYDAVYTLKSKSGNCQNFTHIAIALLRAAGIPARIVGGISLKEPMKIPVDRNEYVVQSLGQGGHAWVEIFSLMWGGCPMTLSNQSSLPHLGILNKRMGLIQTVLMILGCQVPMCLLTASILRQSI